MTKKIIILLMAMAVALWSCAFYFQNLALFLVAVSTLLAAIILKFRSAQPAGMFAISALLSFSVAECVAPLLVDDGKEKTQYDAAYDYPYRNVRMTDLGRQPYAGVNISRKLTSDGEEIYNVRYSIGDDGFRITRPIRITNRRINFLGCSFTFGEGLNDDETLPYFVNKKMDNVTVKNFGFHAWGAHQALALLQSERDTSGSINFFLTVPWHTERSACKPEWSKGSPRYKISQDGRPIRVGRCREDSENEWIDWMLGYSKVYWSIQKLADRKLTADDYELYFALVKEMARLSHLRGQKFIVGYIKANNKSFGDTGFSNEIFQTRLAAMADEVVDLTLITGDREADKKFRIHEQDSHPTALANQERADRLVTVFNRWLE